MIPSGSAEAESEARRRIEVWREGERLDLAIQNLALIPETIAGLDGLTRLKLATYVKPHWIGAAVSGLRPLAKMARPKVARL